MKCKQDHLRIEIWSPSLFLARLAITQREPPQYLLPNSLIYSQLYKVSLEIFGRMRVEIILVSKRERTRGKSRGDKGFRISCLVEDIDYNMISPDMVYNVMSRLEGSENVERESDKGRIYI